MRRSYYHVLLKLEDKTSYHERDIKDINEIYEIAREYQNTKNENFMLYGKKLLKKDISEMIIFESNEPLYFIVVEERMEVKENSPKERDKKMKEITELYVLNKISEIPAKSRSYNIKTSNKFEWVEIKSINKKIFRKINGIESEQNMNNKKIFIVHGHDNELKNEVTRFVEKKLGYEAIILHEQANKGKTIIEKLEENSDVEYAIILYTACDEGRKVDSEEKLNKRARQNVVFEHGYFTSKLGRENVIAINKGHIEVPSDISGIIYISYEEQWKEELRNELEKNK